MLSFSQIKTNVGTRIGDTSTTFATTIGIYINQRYKDIFERFNWTTIVPSYTFPTVIGTQDYALPAGFGKELYVYDTINLVDIAGCSIQDLERVFPNTLATQDQPIRYAIYDSMDASSPPLIVKKIRLYPTPSTVTTISLPYIQTQVDMSASTDLPILDCDTACEYGATADAWRTKRQFAKAADFEGQYERKIQTMIWSKANQPNQIVQFAPRTYDRNQLY